MANVYHTTRHYLCVLLWLLIDHVSTKHAHAYHQSTKVATAFTPTSWTRRRVKLNFHRSSLITSETYRTDLKKGTHLMQKFKRGADYDSEDCLFKDSENGNLKDCTSFSLKTEIGPGGHLNRRNALSLFGTGSFVISQNNAAAASAAVAEAPSKTGLVADLPMKRLKLPRGALGRDYIIIPLKVNGEGPFEFMVDSGLTTELITPHLQKMLNIGSGKQGRSVTALAAGGGNVGSLIELDNVSLCCGKFSSSEQSEYPLPKLYAVVTDFPQEHIDPAHDPVEGMVGMELLEMFDVEFDFANQRLKLWKYGSANTDGLVEISAAVLNESGLLGIRVVSGDPSRKGQPQQPMIGILDCGASFSSVNNAGARLLGISPDPADHRDTPIVTAMGVDGRPINMATAKVSLSFVGGSTTQSDGRLSFEQPPGKWKPWDPTLIGVGDLNVFSDLLGDGRTPYKGPATLVGLDVLSQRRFILANGGTGRARKLFVAPS